MYTNNTDVEAACDLLHITTAKVIDVNPYGIPFIAKMLTAAKKRFSTLFYVYVNSDILLNPLIFPLADKLRYSVRTPV